MNKKIVIIGAGSFVFSSRLTADILSYPELADSTISLVDIDSERLEFAEKIANRIIREGNYTKAAVTSTMDRQEALKGADFVIISILIGGYDAIKKEIDIPMKYGINQCIGDTLTPGGGFGFIKELYSRPDWKETMMKMATWEKPVSLERSHEYGSVIIHAKVTGKKAVIYGNVKNEGLISNLPADSIVEVPIIVDKLGFRPIKIGIIPIHLAAINRTQIIVQQLAVDATLKADPEILFHAMMMDPLTAMSCTLDEIRAMTRDLMQAHKEWIPVMKGKLPKEQPLIYLKKPAEEDVQNVDPVSTWRNNNG